MEAIIAQLVGGAIGGNGAGKLLSSASMGNLGNTIAGAVGGLWPAPQCHALSQLGRAVASRRRGHRRVAAAGSAAGGLLGAGLWRGLWRVSTSQASSWFAVRCVWS